MHSPKINMTWEERGGIVVRWDMDVRVGKRKEPDVARVWA